MSDLRRLPSIERLLQNAQAEPLLVEFGRPLTLEAARTVLAEIRAAAQNGETIPGDKEILTRIHNWLYAIVSPTSRMYLSDYCNAIEETSPALVLHAHSSNFKLIGFTSEPTLAEVIDAAHQKAIPFLDDLGSGALLDTAAFGLSHEPTVQESLEAGADLVCFSGDKLFGGARAGGV